MSKFTQILRIEEEAVEIKAEAHRAFAQNQFEVGSPQGVRYAATYFLSSALYTSLFSAKDAIKLFADAAYAYQSFHHPFGIICDLIARRNTGAAKLTNDTERYLATEEARLFLLIREFAMAYSRFSTDQRGQLQLSIFIRLQEAAFISGNIQGSSFSFFDVTSALAEVSDYLLNRQGDLTYTRDLIGEFVKELDGAAKDSSWRQLRPRSIPYNPISLALTLVLSDTIGDRARTILFKSPVSSEPSMADFYWDLARSLNEIR